MASPAVTALAQDPEGFLWAGTEYGLYRLEGNRFRSFGKIQGLPHVQVLSGGLSPGLQKGMWVDTRLGVCFWDGERFRRPSELGSPGLDRFPCIPLAQGGMILLDFRNQRFHLSLNGEAFRPLIGLEWDGGMTCGAHDPKRQRLFLAGETRLWIQDKGHWRSRPLSPCLKASVLSLWIDPKGRLWLRSPERLFRMEHLDAPLERIHTPLPLNMVNQAQMGTDSQGRLWTHSTQGLVWMDEHQAGMLTEAQGLPKGGANCLLTDRQGIVWIAGYGVHKLLGDGLWTSWSRSQGLPSEVVWSVTKTQDGRHWVGTAAGLAVDGGKVWKVIPGTQNNQIAVMSEDEKGNLWVGHGFSQDRPTALSVVPKGSHQALPIPLPGLSHEDQVMSLLHQGSTLWIGTTSGLFKAQTKGLKLSAEQVHLPGQAKELPIRGLQADDKGGFWAATSRGLGHWDGQTWQWLDRSRGLLDGDIIALAQEPHGDLWLSYDALPGLSRIRWTSSGLRIQEHLRETHPLLQNPVLSMAFGPDGSLWLGTNRGLLRWKQGKIERFGLHTGFPGEDCAQNALWIDTNGEVFVGLSVGLVKGHPQAELPQIPPVVFTWVSNQTGQILKSGDRLPWKRRSLSFRFAPYGTRDIEDLHYAYRMSELGENWQESDLNEAHVAGLEAGSYQFEVKLLNRLGQEGAISAFSFEILRPWWQNWWFKGCCLLGLGGMGFGILRWRTAFLQRRNLHLEALVHARTQALEEANAALLEASLIDPLTGLRNRRYLSLALPEELTQLMRIFKDRWDRLFEGGGWQEDMVLFMVDLDHFKSINDEYGHGVGDRVLQHVALILRFHSRESDYLVRWGGEEFLLLARRTDRSQASKIAEHICEALKTHQFFLDDLRSLHCTCSIGYAGFPFLPWKPEAVSWEETLELADQCLYAAKRAGRDGYIGLLAHDSLKEASGLPGNLTALLKEGCLQVESNFFNPFDIKT